MKTATLIYNPMAGRHPRRRERQVREIVALLEARGFAVQAIPTSGPGSGRELAQAAAARGDDCVLVCGGDGTINEVANGFALSSVPLGILPGGTANMVAKELGLPHHPVRAARQLPGWRPRRIALGVACWGGSHEELGAASETERRYFLSVAGVGFDAYIVHKLAWDFKLALGVPAYIWEALRQALRYPFSPFHCRVDGRELEATFAVAERTRCYAGWLRLAPAASLFEPEFQLCLFKSRSRARYFLYAAAVLARQHLRLRDVELVPGRKITCTPTDTSRPTYFELDGELVGELPATFEILPEALTLLVP